MGRTSHASEIAERVKALVDPVAAREGYELVDVEYVMERGRPVLRVYIDTVPPGSEERGVTVDDCSHVSRIVSDVLDVEDTIAGEYNLEVSSPGLYRPLTKREHFDRVLGQRVRVKTFEKQENRRVFVGTLLERREDQLIIEVDRARFEVPLGDVAKANLEPELPF